MRLLAYLLHLANAYPPVNRTEFYAVKERLLRKYGEFRGHDIQEITKECYGPYSPDGDYYDRIGCQGATCTRCGGTGIYDQRWIRLERWQWHGFVFHRPAGDTRVKPESVQIHGRIEHPHRGRIHNEALLWLYLLCGEWRLLWHSLTSWNCCGWYLWPLSNLQKLMVNARLRWATYRRRCWCGKRYWTLTGAWNCANCRRKDESAEIPF